MKIVAAVIPEYDAPFELRELELAPPTRNEVLIRLVSTGICHTDGAAQHGDMPFPTPGVLGHEGAGVVVGLGEQVTHVSLGDHVILAWPWCGECKRCVAGQPRYCESLGDLLISGSRPDKSTSLSANDQAIHSHFFGQSSFANFCVVNERSLVVVPQNYPLEILGPLACGIATGAGAVFNELRPSLGTNLVVFGAGAVGLSAIMAARCTGVTKIIAVDLHDNRLDLALRYGATHVINANRSDPVQEIKRICGGLADYSLECTGVIPVVRQAIDSVGMLGTACLVGGAPMTAEFSVHHTSTLWGKKIIGILGGGGNSKQLILGLLDLYSQGRFPFDELVVEYPLTEINQALDDSLTGKVLKPVIRMPHDD